MERRVEIHAFSFFFRKKNMAYNETLRKDDHVNKINFKFIDFILVDRENGFFVEFRIPYSLTNFDAVIALRDSREIKLIK